MSRQFTFATILVAVIAVLAGCVPGLAADPRFATNSGARPQGAATTKPPPSGPPPIAAPKNDLSWHDCTSRVFTDAAVPPAPGVQLDCANYDADLDPVNGGSGTLSIGVVRARSNQTPRDAGPLVFTTGSDLPSSTQLPVWLSRAGADVLQTHPVVAVDRRGIGMSSPIDCRDHFDRQEMRDQAQFQSRRRPRCQPFRRLEHRHHKLHRRHRAGRLRLRQCARRLGHRATAQPLGRTRSRAGRHRQRRPGGAGLRRIAA